MSARRVVVASVLLTVLGGCGFGGADRASTTTTQPPRAVVYTAIGGAASVEDDPDAVRREAWPRILFREHLPAQTVFSDLAREGATPSSALASQLPVALELGATVATVWFDDGERGAGGASALLDLVTALVDAGAEVAISAGPGAGGDWAVAVERVAERTGATVVDLDESEDAGDIAQRFANGLAAAG